MIEKTESENLDFESDDQPMDRSANFGTWDDGIKETSFSTPRRTAQFDKKRSQYTFGGVDSERIKMQLDDSNRPPSISTGSQSNPIKFPNVQEYTYNEEPSFQARDSSRQQDTVYQYISKEKSRLDALTIFDELCDKEKYSTAKVCKITGKAGKLKNWYYIFTF